MATVFGKALLLLALHTTHGLHTVLYKDNNHEYSH